MQTIEVMGDRASVAEPGRLGQAIIDYGVQLDDVSVVDVREPSDPDFLVYCRKVCDTLGLAVEYCNETGILLAVLSSSMDFTLYQNPRFPMIIVPNSCLPVIQFMTDVEAAAKTHKGWSMHIVEHHQSSKADISGTAKALAKMVGLGRTTIESVRNWAASSSEYNLPESTQDGYAIHRVTFTSPDGRQVTDALQMLIQGREQYAEGVIDIYDSFVANGDGFPDGQLQIVDLVKSGVVVVRYAK